MQKSHFASYIEERLGKSIIEDEYGFATYLFEQDYVYIEDIYVKKGHRNEDHASRYADQIAQIARENGYKTMMGSVAVGTNGDTTSLKVLLAYGFKLWFTDKNMIYFKKEIGE